MRLKISITALDNKLPVNYNYSFSSAIYHLFNLGSKDFIRYLDKIGYTATSKKFRLFTYALLLDNFKIEKGVFNLENPEFNVLLSLPVIEDFINHNVLGKINKHEIFVEYKQVSYKCRVNQIEILNDPQFTESMKLRFVSPIILSADTETAEGIKTYFLRYDSNPEEINKAITQDLTNKLNFINSLNVNKHLPTAANTSLSITNNNIKLEWDNDFIRHRLKYGKRISSKIFIDNIHSNIFVVGTKAPFTISGNKELIKTGYQCGFGERSSLGFGMAEIMQPGSRFNNTAEHRDKRN